MLQHAFFNKPQLPYLNQIPSNFLVHWLGEYPDFSAVSIESNHTWLDSFIRLLDEHEGS